ncbi:MAG: restriction endonuclease subunit S [Gammaproteobacteria bacterium]
MPDPLIDIRPDHWAIVADILRRHAPDREVWAFGSRATWNAKEYSDLDLAVIGQTPLSLCVSAALADDFAESDLPFKVDVVDWATTSESFRKIIERDKVVVQEGKRTESGVGGEWRETTLDQLGQIITGKTPPSSVPGCFGGSIPFVTPTDFDGRRVFESTGRYLTEQGANAVAGSRIPGRSVMVSCIGSDMGKAAVAGRECVTNQQINSIAVESRDDPLFVYYNLSTRKAEIRAAASGSAQPILKKSAFGQLDILLPPPDEQRAIAHILGTLDDKIELNRRMNETLEAMARALFKSWFVDFLPVRAKQRARTQTGDPVRAKQPKNVGWVSPSGHNPPDNADGGLRGYAANPPYELPPHIADLFPSRFVDSELGEIPEGWEVGPLDSVLVLQRGFDLPSNQRTSGAYPVLAACGPSGTHNEFMVRGPSVTTGRSGVLGKVFYVHDDFWPLNTSLWVKEFRRSMPAYACHLLRGLDLGLFNAGSAVPTLNRNHVHNLPTLLPPMGLIAAFERVATTSLKRQKHNDDQSLTLAALRDTLLPKLISGELRVPHAVELIDGAVSKWG